jgi:hypothetical protein
MHDNAPNASAQTDVSATLALYLDR